MAIQQNILEAAPVTQRQTAQPQTTTEVQTESEIDDLGLPFYYNLAGTVKEIINMGKQTINSITVTRPVHNGVQTTTTTVQVNTIPDTKPCCPGLYIEIAILAIIVAVGIFGFIKSVRSRKYYKCPSCGESFRAENMESKTCKVCGAELEETDDPNINDTTK